MPPYTVRKYRDPYGHLFINGRLYMGPFSTTPPRVVMVDRNTGNLTALTTLGTLDSQVLTLSTLSPPAPAGFFGPLAGPYLSGEGPVDIRLYVEDGALAGELVEQENGKVSNAPVYAVSQVGNYGLRITAADGWMPGDSFTTSAVDFMP